MQCLFAFLPFGMADKGGEEDGAVVTFADDKEERPVRVEVLSITRGGRRLYSANGNGSGLRSFLIHLQEGLLLDKADKHGFRTQQREIRL